MQRVAGPVRPDPGIGKKIGRMQDVLYHMTTIAVLAVFLVLCAGLWTMSRGTSPNLSQKLMRWRVALQFAAIVIIMLFALLARQQSG
jgi:Mg2+ and Co2+ transporter CorA